MRGVHQGTSHGVVRRAARVIASSQARSIQRGMAVERDRAAALEHQRRVTCRSADLSTSAAVSALRPGSIARSRQRGFLGRCGLGHLVDEGPLNVVLAELTGPTRPLASCDGAQERRCWMRKGPQRPRTSGRRLRDQQHARGVLALASMKSWSRPTPASVAIAVRGQPGHKRSRHPQASPRTGGRRWHAPRRDGSSERRAPVFHDSRQ
jgi:hypothetical protein